MNMLTKLALGAMGRLRPVPAKGDATPIIALPAPDASGGMPLMEALAKRHSAREFASTALPLPLLSNLLWAANGINRTDGHHTAPSAMNVQEIDIYVALPAGAYLYERAATDRRQRRAPRHRLSGFRRRGAARPRLCRRPRPHDADPGRQPRKLRVRRGGRHCPERLPVRRRQRALHRDPRLDQPRRDRRRTRIEPRPPGAAVADGGVSEGVSWAVASAKLNAMRLARCPTCPDSDRVSRCITISRSARLGHQQAHGTTRGYPQLEVRLSPLGRVQRRGSQLE